jgi:hypothetical protein
MSSIQSTHQHNEYNQHHEYKQHKPYPQHNHEQHKQYHDHKPHQYKQRLYTAKVGIVNYANVPQKVRRNASVPF